MKLTKLFSYSVDQGGSVTRNYIKLFSNCTLDDLNRYYKYLYQNKMYSELGNFTDAIKLFTNRYSGWNLFKKVADWYQRNQMAKKLHEIRRDRDIIDKTRQVKGVETGLLDKNTGQEWIAAPDVDMTNKIGYKENPATKAAWDALREFQSTRGDSYKSNGELNKLDLSAGEKVLDKNHWDNNKFFETIDDDAHKRNDFKKDIMNDVMVGQGKLIDDAVNKRLQSEVTPASNKPVRRLTVGRKSSKPVRRIVVGKKST